MSLYDHRLALAANPNAYQHDVKRLYGTVIPHLKKAGFLKNVGKVDRRDIALYVDSIFKTQSHLPFYHVDGNLPFCWNRPQHWNLDFIKYEWGHLHSKNQNNKKTDAMDLCIQSSRCNQHIQASMNIEEVMEWTRGSALETRISSILRARSELFKTKEWEELLIRLK